MAPPPICTMAFVCPEEVFSLENTVWGHHIHVHKTSWTPVAGQMLQVRAEYGNLHDCYAVAAYMYLHIALVGHTELQLY